MIAVKNDTQPQWQLQTAKAQFSQVVKRAVDSGPQLVTKGGEPAVYIVSAKWFETELSRSGQDRKSILLASPHLDTVLDLDRAGDEGREVEL
jgi:prevent-host-death family protein